MPEKVPEGQEEESEEESFERMINLDETGTEVSGEEFEEVSVPRFSFSLNALEAMLNIGELLLKAASEPEYASNATTKIRELRERLTRVKKKERKIVKKPEKKKTAEKKKERKAVKKTKKPKGGKKA
ncbi:MAG: hypothetical protein QXP80_00925 [Zestosphaera sp.]